MYVRIFLAPKGAQEMQMSYASLSVIPHYALKLFKAPLKDS